MKKNLFILTILIIILSGCSLTAKIDNKNIKQISNNKTAVPILDNIQKLTKNFLVITNYFSLNLPPQWYYTKYSKSNSVFLADSTIGLNREEIYKNIEGTTLTFFFDPKPITTKPLDNNNTTDEIIFRGGGEYNPMFAITRINSKDKNNLIPPDDYKLIKETDTHIYYGKIIKKEEVSTKRTDEAEKMLTDIENIFQTINIFEKEIDSPNPFDEETDNV